MKTYLYFAAYIAQDIALTLFKIIFLKIIPAKSSLDPPKSFQNPPQIDPRED